MPFVLATGASAVAAETRSPTTCSVTMRQAITSGQSVHSGYTNCLSVAVSWDQSYCFQLDSI